MLRTARLAAKLGFSADAASLGPLRRMASLLRQASPRRLRTEMIKMLLNGHGGATYALMRRHRLFDVLFPGSARPLSARTRAGDAPCWTR